MPTKAVFPKEMRPNKGSAMCAARRASARGFTLIELLVVISIVALLVAVLLPSLKRARDQAKLTACAASLRQLGTGIHTYASEHGGYIPRGPEPAHPFDFASNILATNQLWIGTGPPGPPATHPMEYNGLGTLMATTVKEPRVFFCPADDNFNLQEESPKIGTESDAYGSYLYRQLDHLPAAAAIGRLDRMGTNLIAGRRVPVDALALDANSLGPGTFHHTNHRGRMANILFRDASVLAFSNRGQPFAIPAVSFDDFARIPAAIDQVLTNADYSYRGLPENAPKIATSKSN